MPRGSRRRSGGRGGPKGGYYWDGFQWPATAVDTTVANFALIAGTAQEFMPGTLMRIRGNISLRGIHATTTGLVNMKLMYVEMTDAAAMSGDHAPIDTHEEDIAIRQLWTWAGFVGTLDEQNLLYIPVDVKAKLKLEPHGKKQLLLMMQNTSASTVQTMGYLRALVRYS